MREKRRGDGLSHREVNELRRIEQKRARLRSVSHSMIRDDQPVGFPTFQQREAIVVAEDFPLGLAGGTENTYEIRFRYFRQFSDDQQSTSASSSSSSGDDNLWQTDERGKPAFMDSTNVGTEFEAGDKVTVWFDQQRGMWIAIQATEKRTLGGVFGCCGPACYSPEEAIIPDCGGTLLIPRLRLTLFGAVDIFSGGVQDIDLLHVSGCTFQSDAFPIIFDFIPDDSDSSPQVRNVYWRADISPNDVHGSTLQLIEEGTGEVILSYESQWYFDPLCGTSFGIKDRMEVVPGLAEIAPCILCLYPYVNKVTSPCLESLADSIGRTREWPEFIRLELIDVVGAPLLNDHAQNHQLRFVPGSVGTWVLLSDNPVANAMPIPSYSTPLNGTAIGYKKLATLAVSPTVPITPNGVELGDPLFRVSLTCQGNNLLLNWLGRTSSQFVGGSGTIGWNYGDAAQGSFTPQHQLNPAAFDPDDLHFPIQTTVFVETASGSSSAYNPVALSNWILHVR